MRVDVRTDISKALKKIDVSKSGAKQAITRALNKTAVTARAQSAREIRAAGYGLKIGELKKAITIFRASPARLAAHIRASVRPIPLIRYRARQTASGVTVNVLHGRKTILHAFIATMPTGHKGVFVRVDTHAQAKAIESAIASRNRRVPSGKKHGLPIKQLFGPSIPSAFANKTVRAAMIRAIRERFPVVLQQELRHVADSE